MINNSVVNSGLPQLPEKVPNELYNEFAKLYNAVHKLEFLLAQWAGTDSAAAELRSQISLDETVLSGNMNRFNLPAFEDLTYGQCVALMSDAGVPKFRKANATNNTKPAFGFVNTPGITAAGSYVEVIGGMGNIQSVAGLVVADRYFLSTVDGLITNVAPVAAGNIEQPVGRAIGITRLFMNIYQLWIQH